jgi:long-subunit acyl-CoA synthetase (AMP-forming)
VMSGYFADETATEKAFRGGWFHSGDLAVWHLDVPIGVRLAPRWEHRGARP